jgi:hypothetical protein
MPFNHIQNFLLLRGVIQTPNISNKKIHMVGEKLLIKISSFSPILPFPLTFALSSAKANSTPF